MTLTLRTSRRPPRNRPVSISQFSVLDIADLSLDDAFKRHREGMETTCS